MNTAQTLLGTCLRAGREAASADFLGIAAHDGVQWNDDPTSRFGAGLAYYNAFAVVLLVFVVVELATSLLVRSTAEGLLMEQV